jgi:cbb3-type cytochrome oxidase maturation protein
MESLYLLIPIALLIIVFAVKLLFWAINSGQYDDLDTEGHRILFDEPVEKKPKSSESTTLMHTKSMSHIDQQQREDQR